jgi:hypothetical protein
MRNRKELQKSNIISNYLDLLNKNNKIDLNINDTQECNILVILPSQEPDNSIYKRSIEKILKLNVTFYNSSAFENTILDYTDFNVIICVGLTITDKLTNKLNNLDFYGPIYSINCSGNNTVFDYSFSDYNIAEILYTYTPRIQYIDTFNIGIFLDCNDIDITILQNEIQYLLNYNFNVSVVNLYNYSHIDNCSVIIDSNLQRPEALIKYIASHFHCVITNNELYKLFANINGMVSFDIHCNPELIIRYYNDLKNETDSKIVHNIITDDYVNNIYDTIINRKRKRLVSENIPFDLPDINVDRKISIELVNTKSSHDIDNLLKCLYCLDKNILRKNVTHSIYVDIDIEYTFSEYIIEYSNNWIGFVHNSDIEYLLENKSFINSIINCYGLICMSKLIEESVQQIFDRCGINVKLYVLDYPSDSVTTINTDNIWTINKYHKNNDKKLIQINSNDPFVI